MWRGVEALSGSLTSRDFAGNNTPSTSRMLTGKARIPSALVQHVLHRRIFGLGNFSFDASWTRHPKPSHKLIRPCSCNYRRLVTAISDFGCSSLSLESQVRLLQSRTTQRGNPLSPSWPQGALQHLLFEALRGEHPHPRTRVLYSKWLRLCTTTCWCLSYLTTSCNPPHSLSRISRMFKSCSTARLSKYVSAALGLALVSIQAENLDLRMLLQALPHLQVLDKCSCTPAKARN